MTPTAISCAWMGMNGRRNEKKPVVWRNICRCGVTLRELSALTDEEYSFRGARSENTSMLEAPALL